MEKKAVKPSCSMEEAERIANEMVEKRATEVANNPELQKGKEDWEQKLLEMREPNQQVQGAGGGGAKKKSRKRPAPSDSDEDSSTCTIDLT